MKKKMRMKTFEKEKNENEKPVIEKKHIIICDEENDILDTFHQINKEEENMITILYRISRKWIRNSLYPSPVPLEWYISVSL